MNVDEQPITGMEASPTSVAAPAGPVHPSAKRKRVTKACLVCAKSRRKCDGVQPQCGTCQSQGVNCSWSEVPTRRGPPKGYRKGAADPATLIPKIAKIREHIQALQVAYGESYVLDQLHRALFNGCEHWVIAGVSGAGVDKSASPEEPTNNKIESDAQAAQSRLSPVEEWVSEQRDERSPVRAPYDYDRYQTPEPREDDETSVHEEEDGLEEGSSSGKAFLATSMRYMSRGGSLSPPSRPPASSDAQTHMYAHTRYTVHPDHPMSSGSSSIGMALQPVVPISDEQYTLQSAFGQQSPTHHPRIQAQSLAHRTSHGASSRRRASPYPPSIASSSATAPSASAYSDSQSTVYGSSRDSYSQDRYHQLRHYDADTQHQAHSQQQQHFHRYHHPSSPASETVYRNTVIADAGGGSSGNNGRVTTHGGHGTHIAPSSSYAPSEPAARAASVETNAIRNIRTRASAPSEATSAPDTYQTPQPNPNEVEVLLKTYWAAIHPHWPILYKPKFDGFSLFSISEEVPHSLLYAIYALAARLVPERLNDQAADAYRRIAEAELQAEGPFKSHINKCEALFLLSLYYHGEGNQRQAWVLSGLAAMMAFDLGLHKTRRDLKIPPQELEQQVRVFWNIYVYEKVLAAEMGRPVMIRRVHCEARRLSEDQSDEYETLITSPKGEPVILHTISIFNAAVDLFSIMERILNEVHTVSQLPARHMRDKLVADFDRELEDWQKNIGPRCTYPRSDDMHPTRTRYLTHAWYHIAMILLHRPLIPRHRDGQVFVSNVHHKKATEHANQLVDLLAQFAAGADIDKLPPNDAYLIFTAAVIQVFNFCANEPALRDAARPRLEKCIEWLRGLAGTWSAASQFKYLLDTFSQVASNSIMTSHAPRAVSSPQDGSAGQDSSILMHGQLQSGRHEMAYQRSTATRTNTMQTHTDYDESQDLDHGVMTEMQQSQSQAQHSQMTPADADVGAGAMQTDAAGEQGFYAQEIFQIENFYWNSYQALGMQQQQMPGTMGPYPAHNVHTNAQVPLQAQSRPPGEAITQGQQGQHTNNVYFHLVRALGDAKPQT